jgi:hypothetical protein
MIGLGMKKWGLSDQLNCGAGSFDRRESLRLRGADWAALIDVESPNKCKIVVIV